MHSKPAEHGAADERHPADAVAAAPRGALLAHADAEYQPCSDVLLCRGLAPSDTALRQHASLVATLRSAGVTCHFLDPAPGAPFQCYTRDSCAVTPWGLIVARMGLPKRWIEPMSVKQFALRSGLRIWREVERGTFEGGDLMLLRPGLALIGCSGDRTTQSAADDLTSWFARKDWACRTITYLPKYRHLDLVVGILDVSNLLCHVQALAPEAVRWLEQAGYTLHAVDDDEVWRMGCNILNVGNRTVIAAQECPKTNALMRSLGFRVLEVDIASFADDLGGVHCLTQGLQRAKSETDRRMPKAV